MGLITRAKEWAGTQFVQLGARLLGVHQVDLEETTGDEDTGVFLRPVLSAESEAMVVTAENSRPAPPPAPEPPLKGSLRDRVTRARSER